MDELSLQDLVKVIEDALETRRCKHLFLQGNHQIDMFHDKVDKINVWNRIWLSAKATGTQIFSVVILDSHLHLCTLLKKENSNSAFMHHYRLSITQYYNRRYNLKGMLGMRTHRRGVIHDIEDLIDCICYHIRNMFHHRISFDYLDYQFSTVKFVFGLSDIDPATCYTRETLPSNLAKAYLPARATLPDGWLMTQEGMIVPPPEVFRADIVESLFHSQEEYLETLTKRTRREENDEDEPFDRNYVPLSNDVHSLDEFVTAFVSERFETPIPSMSDWQRMVSIFAVKEEFPKVSLRALSRIFGIPVSTLRYRLKNWRRRE